METWQIDHITKYLPDLMQLTKINKAIEAVLLANNILVDADIKELDAEKNEDTKSFNLYSTLKTRRNAYKVLTRALIIYGKTGAALILINGLLTQGFSKPLTHLGISTVPDNFQNEDIIVHAKRFKISQFFPGGSYSLSLLQQIFRDTISELEFYETFIKNERTFVLTNDTIPRKPPVYIRRFLSNRIKFDESIFNQRCPDVFVFKNTVKRFKVSAFGSTVLSDTQQDCITSRFICLTENEDWIDLKKLAKVPIHLINYDTDQKSFLLEDTSTPSDILMKLGTHNEHVYVPEDFEETFVQQQLSKYAGESSVCICDTPGMGKTLLLASIARRMAEKSTDRAIVYIPLSTLCTTFFESTPVSNINNHTVLAEVCKYVSPSQEHSRLLFELVKAKLLRVEIFIDGYDEAQSDNVDCIKQILPSITSDFPKVRFFITSKRHMRRELENKFHTISYDIKPFEHFTQLEFLVKFWSTNKPNCDVKLLQNYAATCLEATNRLVSGSYKTITEVPRLCKVIAETYADKVQNSLERGDKTRKFPFDISKILEKFVIRRIMEFYNTEHKDKIDDIKLVHTCLALKILFPTDGFNNDDIFSAVDHLMSFDILKFGIIQQHQTTAVLNAPFEFIHDSLAEYFVAEYFSKRLHNERIFNSLLECVLHTSDKKYKLIAPICDLALRNISKEVKRHAVLFCNSNSPKQIFTLLYACCEQNLKNTFSLLKEALKHCDNKEIREYFTPDTCYNLLSVCIRSTTCQVFQCCVQLFVDVLHLDVANIPISVNQDTFLQLAVKYLNYEAVKHLRATFPLKGQNILKMCVANSSDNDSDIQSREDILELLLDQDPTIINEASTKFSLYNIHPKLNSILVQFRRTLTEGVNDCDRLTIGGNVSHDKELLTIGSFGSVVNTDNKKRIDSAQITSGSTSTTGTHHQGGNRGPFRSRSRQYSRSTGSSSSTTNVSSTRDDYPNLKKHAHDHHSKRHKSKTTYRYKSRSKSPQNRKRKSSSKSLSRCSSHQRTLESKSRSRSRSRMPTSFRHKRSRSKSKSKLELPARSKGKRRHSRLRSTSRERHHGETRHRGRNQSQSEDSRDDKMSPSSRSRSHSFRRARKSRSDSAVRKSSKPQSSEGRSTSASSSSKNKDTEKGSTSKQKSIERQRP